MICILIVVFHYILCSIPFLGLTVTIEDCHLHCLSWFYVGKNFLFKIIQLCYSQWLPFILPTSIRLLVQILHKFIPLDQSSVFRIFTILHSHMLPPLVFKSSIFWRDYLKIDDCTGLINKWSVAGMSYLLAATFQWGCKHGS